MDVLWIPHLGNVLFFGCRSESKDFYFRSEWEKAKQMGHLALFTAFSRDQVRNRVISVFMIDEECLLLFLHGRSLLRKGASWDVINSLQICPPIVQKHLEIYLKKDSPDLGFDSRKSSRWKPRKPPQILTCEQLTPAARALTLPNSGFAVSDFKLVVWYLGLKNVCVCTSAGETVRAAPCDRERSAAVGPDHQEKGLLLCRRVSVRHQGSNPLV